MSKDIPKMRIFTVVLSILGTSLCASGMRIVPSMKFDYNMSLVSNDIYTLFWSIRNEEITFEVHAKTLGYVGFGLSKTGGMKHADIVIGWVKDGNVYFQDRYSTRNAEPKIDDSQDWKLLEGKEEGDYTIFKFSRPLKTCDPFDVDITDETMRVIYAFHAEDPVEATGLSYHGRNQRGTKSFTFISHTTDEEQTLPSDAISMDFVVDKVEVPAKDTTYYCHGFKIPKLPKKHHVIMVEPLVEPGQEGLVHHMVLYACTGEMKEDIHGVTGDCELERMQDMQEKCSGALFLYASGIGKPFMPIEAGVPLGADDSITHFRLEIHYDNPKPSQAGLVDSSGMRLWLTPTLRKYDAWLVLTGLVTNRNHVIPPNFEGLTNYGYCPNKCLRAAMEGTEAADGIKVFAAAVHSHLLGTNLRLRHFRDGVELPPIIKDDFFDFNFQYLKMLKEPVIVKPNDNLIAECTYNSEERDKVTYGGLSTRNEMCFIFVMYYPKLSNFSSCLSMMPPGATMKYTGAEIKSNEDNSDDFQLVGEKYEGKKWWEIIEETDWSNKTMRDSFQKAMTDPSSDQVMICSAHPDFFWVEKPFEVSKFYEEEDKCEKNPARNTSGASSLLSLSVVVQVVMLILAKYVF